MKVEDILTGELVRVPRKVKKRARMHGLVITARVGRKTWIAGGEK